MGAKKKYVSSLVLFSSFTLCLIQTTRDPVDPGLWIVVAIFIGFALIAQLLVRLGIMQITPVNQMPRTNSNRTVMDYRNYHYNSIIAKINSSGVTVTTVDEAIRTYSSLFNVGEKAAKPFFQNQFVMSALGLSIQDTPQVGYQSESSNQKSEKVSSNFWGSISDGVAKNEANSDETCAGHACSNPISAFDFRCYQCRERFCESCKGNGLTCPSCS
jgi:hypothetical protein